MFNLDESAVAFVSLEVLFFIKIDDSRSENIKLFNYCPQAVMRDVGEEHRDINVRELTKDFVTFAVFGGHAGIGVSMNRRKTFKVFQFFCLWIV